MIIKKVFDGNFDEEVHSDFLKFGRGEFKSKYLLVVKAQKDKFSIKTGPELANTLVKESLKKISGKILIKGVIVSTGELEISFSNDKKQFMGIKQFKVDAEVDPREILDCMEKYPRAFFALSYKTDSYELKIKPKAPKSAKPSTKGEKEVVADFCSLKTKDRELIKTLFFDVGTFKEIKISHDILIEKIIYPKDFASMKPEDVREQSKRKGKVIRKIEIDGKTLVKEAEFEA